MKDILVGSILMGCQCLIFLWLKNEGEGITWKRYFNHITFNKFAKKTNSEGDKDE